MIINGTALLLAAPIKNMLTGKERGPLTSYGLSEAGYDIRLKQDVDFRVSDDPRIGPRTRVNDWDQPGNFVIASAIEEFDMPDNLIGIVHDKSTWARQGLSVLNTVIEPKFCGGLTLELVYHGREPLFIPAGTGIAQVLFHEITEKASYDGKYQNQSTEPVPARFG